MMKLQLALILGVLAAAPNQPAPLDSQPPVPAPSSENSGSTFVAPPSKQPFTNIFRPPQGELSRVQPAPAIEAQPRIVCGMTLMPARPELDPKMAAQVPPPPNMEYKVRAIRPRICRE
jgi:hypothetical protein